MSAEMAPSSTKSSARVAVVDAGESCPALPIIDGVGAARAVVWPGMGASMRSMHRIMLQPGSATVQLKHAGEAVYYVVLGNGIVREPASASSEAVVEGSMVHIEGGTAYSFHAGEVGLELVGGPCPADPALYRHLG